MAGVTAVEVRGEESPGTALAKGVGASMVRTKSPPGPSTARGAELG